MTRRKMRNHSPTVKGQVAIAALKSDKMALRGFHTVVFSFFATFSPFALVGFACRIG